MHVAEILFYNMYIPFHIRKIVDDYYSAEQSNIPTLYTIQQDKTSFNRRDILLKYLVNEDIQVSANSSYTTLNDFFGLGEIGILTDKIVSTEGAYSSAVNQDHNNFRNIFNYSLWDKTEPMNINFKVVLYAKTDPFIDVVIPAYLMMSHAGIDKIPDLSSGTSGKFAVPGVSFSTAMNLYNRRKEASNQITLSSAKKKYQDEYDFESAESSYHTWVFYEKGKTRSEATRKVETGPSMNTANSKILSFLISGLLYIDIGTIKSISVTCSKHTAKTNATYKQDPNANENIIFEGNYPIWMELDLQIESIRPAVSYMLWNSLNGNNVLNRQEDQNGIKVF